MEIRSEVVLIHHVKGRGSVGPALTIVVDSLGNFCCYCNFPGRRKDILKRHLFLFLTVSSPQGTGISPGISHTKRRKG